MGVASKSTDPLSTTAVAILFARFSRWLSSYRIAYAATERATDSLVRE